LGQSHSDGVGSGRRKNRRGGGRGRFDLEKKSSKAGKELRAGCNGGCRSLNKGGVGKGKKCWGQRKKGQGGSEIRKLRGNLKMDRPPVSIIKKFRKNELLPRKGGVGGKRGKGRRGSVQAKRTTKIRRTGHREIRKKGASAMGNGKKRKRLRRFGSKKGKPSPGRGTFLHHTTGKKFCNEKENRNPAREDFHS